MLSMKQDHEVTEERIKVADQILDRTTTILESFAKLQQEVSNLQRLKSQYQIYIKLFNNDKILLQELYQDLKSKLENDKSNKNIVLISPSVPHAQEVQPQPQPQIKKGEDGKQLPYALFLAKINWEIDIHNHFFSKEHIRLRYVLNANAVICTVTFDPTGERFAFADGRTIFLVNSKDGSLLQTFQIPQTIDQKNMQTRVLRFSPDSQFIVANGSDNLIYVFTLKTGELFETLDGHTDVVSSLLFTSDSRRLISGGYDGKIIVWDIYTKEKLKEKNHKSESYLQNEHTVNKEGYIVDIVYGFDESFIIVGFMNGKVGIYDANFSQEMSPFLAHQMPLLSVSSSRKSELICTASQDNTLKVWAIRALATRRQTLISHTNYVITSAFSLNDQYLFSGSKDESLKLWNISTGDIECSINAHNNTVFKIDHHPTEYSILTCGGDGMVCYWEYDLPA